MLKKFLIGSLIGSVSLLGLSYTNAQANPGQGGGTFFNQGGGTFFNQRTDYNPGVAGANEGLKGEGLLQSIQRFINYVIGFLAMIALGYLLFGWFKMLTAGGDDNKFKDGIKILKQAGLGLVFIGLSWLIVSFIFQIIGVMVWW